MTNANFSFYSFAIERCKDDDLRKMAGLGSCKSKEDIDDIINWSIVHVDILDHYPDVLNYHHPFQDYFYSMNHIMYSNFYVNNEIDFNPILLKTNYGIVIDKSKTETTYLFSESTKQTNSEIIYEYDENGNPILDDDGNQIRKSSGFVCIYNFYMGNNLQHYERTYQKLQDVLSKIGGFGKTTFIFMTTLNLLVSKFIVVLDTEDFLISIDKNINNNNVTIPVNTIQQNETYENKKIFDFKNENKYNIKDIASFGNNNLYNFNKDINKMKSYEQKDEDILQKPNKKVNFCWCQYIWDMICCGTSNKNIAYYENFRKRILSEENMIISHSNLYKAINFLGLDNHEDFIFDKKYTTIIY
jgi:hypothetical protein